MSLKGDGLDRLLRPGSIAVIGGREAEKAALESLKVGFSGPIYPVSRSREVMAGVKAHASIEDLPEAPDAAFLAVPAEATIEAVRTLSEMGAGGAVLYASGFAEIGDLGKDRQRRLLAAAGSMGILGPNCYGIVNYLDRVALWPDDHGGLPIDRGVALVSQSGNVSISLSMQKRGLPLAFLAALGNQAKDGVAHIVSSLLRDDRITAIGLFIESAGNIDDFRLAAKMAAEKRVPIVVLKNGDSEAAARVAMSHTSSMTGSAGAFNALCDRYAVIRTRTLPEFLEVLKFLHVHPGLYGNRLMTMSCSGGEAGLLADAADRAGIPMPAFPKERERALNTVLGDKVTIDNPLDYHTYIWGDASACEACYTEALRHPDIDVGVLALDTADNPDMELFGWEEAISGICKAARATGKPTIVAASLQENMPLALGRRFLEAGVVPIQGFDDALSAINKAAWYGANVKSAASLQTIQYKELQPGQEVVLDEWRSKKALAQYGLPLPQGALISSATEAVAAAQSIGYPVVVKVCSARLAHKTEASGVALNLGSADEVQSAVEGMEALSDRFIVEAMAQGGVAELIVGVTRDPQIGPLLMIGAGGILAELMKDAVLLMLPVTKDDISGALDRLAIAPILNGYRGRPAMDREALVSAIAAIAAFGEDHQDRLLELDVNPLIALPEGVVAADALIRWIKED